MRKRQFLCITELKVHRKTLSNTLVTDNVLDNGEASSPEINLCSPGPRRNFLGTQSVINILCVC